MNAITPIDISWLRDQAPSIFASHAHESRSADYTFIPTIDAVLALTKEGFTVASAKQSRTRIAERKNYTKHMIRLRAPGGDGGDELYPEVVLINAHDGGAAYKAMAGVFRLLCSNGMVVSEGTVETVRIPHRGDVLTNVVDGVMRVSGHARELRRVYHNWRGIELSGAAQDELAKRARDIRWPLVDGKVATNVPSQSLLQVRRSADNGNDLWHVFNRVQENVIQGGLEYTVNSTRAGGSNIRHMRSRPIRGVAEDVKINQQLWALAEEFAQAA